MPSSDRLQKFITPIARLIDIASLQRYAVALGGKIRAMHREVTPPGSAIIPQVMVGIFVVDTNCELVAVAWSEEADSGCI